MIYRIEDEEDTEIDEIHDGRPGIIQRYMRVIAQQDAEFGVVGGSADLIQLSKAGRATGFSGCRFPHRFQEEKFPGGSWFLVSSS